MNTTGSYYDYDPNNYEFPDNYLDNEDVPTTTTHQITPIYSVAIFLYIVVFVLGVPGNGLVLWVTTFEMKRTVNSVWFLNLAVADLLCCISAPFSIMTIVLGYWPLGLFACKLIYSMLLVNMYASVLLLTAISIDRCALVLKPVWCQNKRTVKKAYVACLVIWILAFVMSSPSFIFRIIYKRRNGNEICTYTYISVEEQHRQKVENFITAFRFLMGFVIPFLVITACYSVLMKRVSGRYTQSTKSLKIILIVVIGFFVCWFPYHVAGFILSIESSSSSLFRSTHMVDPILVAIAFANSCVNPIIYVLVGREFKSKFKRSIRFILQNALAEDPSQTIDSKKSKSTLDTRNTEAAV